MNVYVYILFFPIYTGMYICIYIYMTCPSIRSGPSLRLGPRISLGPRIRLGPRLRLAPGIRWCLRMHQYAYVYIYMHSVTHASAFTCLHAPPLRIQI